jgi:hypothetical protein
MAARWARARGCVERRLRAGANLHIPTNLDIRSRVCRDFHVGDANLEKSEPAGLFCRLLHVGPHPVAAATAVVADTTGAGDAFNAGLVTALSAGAAWPAALEAATRFATEIVSRPSHERWRQALLDRAPAD